MLEGRFEATRLVAAPPALATASRPEVAPPSPARLSQALSTKRRHPQPRTNPISRAFDELAALRIAATHPNIDPEVIVGMAFDSLFRQLCGQQALATPEDRQVFSSFAFVSAWAGVLMAVELLRAFAGEAATTIGPPIPGMFRFAGRAYCGTSIRNASFARIPLRMVLFIMFGAIQQPAWPLPRNDPAHCRTLIVLTLLVQCRYIPGEMYGG
jgi:hypothetical protein